MEALLSLESLVQAGFCAAALLLALGSAGRSLRGTPSTGSGEVVWSVVAVLMLAGVAVAVHLGSGHGV
ncbi:MAG: hypothetical protein ABR538_09895 [Candidatus Binatia bacterium]